MKVMHSYVDALEFTTMDFDDAIRWGRVPSHPWLKQGCMREAAAEVAVVPAILAALVAVHTLRCWPGPQARLICASLGPPAHPAPPCCPAGSSCLGSACLARHRRLTG